MIRRLTKTLGVLALVVVVVVAMLVLTPAPALASNECTVTVTATGQFINITVLPTDEPLGDVATSSTTWAYGSVPSDPLIDGECTFEVTNTSSVIIDVTVHTEDFTGGVGWTCSDTATPGVDTFGMMAGASGVAHSAMVIVKKTATYNTLKASLAATTNFKWEFYLLAPTEFGDGDEKSGDITLTASAS